MAKYGSDYQRFGERFLDDIFDWIAEYFDPEDVFDVDRLKRWAEQNNYMKVTEYFDKTESEE